MSSPPVPSPSAPGDSRDDLAARGTAGVVRNGRFSGAPLSMTRPVDAEEARSLELFDLAADGYVLTTAGGVIRFANRATAQLLNVAPHFLVGKPLAVYVAGQHRRAFRDRVSAVRTTGAGGTWETALKPRHAAARQVVLTVSPTLRDGAIENLLWMMRDVPESPAHTVGDGADGVGEQVRAHAPASPDAAGALRLQTAVLSAIVDGLESPPVAISGYASVIRRLTRDWDHPDLPLLHEALAGMESSAAAMGRLMSDLVHLARLPFGAELDIALVDLVDVARRVAGSFAQDPHGHQIRIASVRPWLYVSGDVERLERVIAVLLTNAVMYSPEGGEITVEMEQSGGDAVIRVRDPGVGIPARDLPHIGEQRHRGINVAAWTGGTGIGLIVARHVVEQHSGAIGIDSRHGGGSVVTVRLPIDGPSPRTT